MTGPRQHGRLRRLARRAGMAVVVEAGDADAHVTLPPATPLSFTSEILADRIALYDFALKTHVEAWRRVGVTLAGADACAALGDPAPLLGLTDPPVRLLRRIIPQLTIGAVRFDLSIMVLLLVAFIGMQLAFGAAASA